MTEAEFDRAVELGAEFVARRAAKGEYFLKHFGVRQLLAACLHDSGEPLCEDEAERCD